MFIPIPTRPWHARFRRPLRPLRAAAAAAVCLAALLSGPGQAQQGSQRIVAVVNDESITAYDVDQRILLSLGTDPQSVPPDQMRRMATQVLRGMIDERLQLQEAKRLGIDVLPEELEDAIARIERQNNIPAGQLEATFKAEGLNFASFLEQAKAAIVWPKVVRRRAARLTTVAEDEIDEALVRIRENADKPTNLVSQIFLSVESPQDETEVRTNAERLYEQLVAGAPFPALAQQFSQDSSAATGGDIGWVEAGQMPPEVEEVLGQMPIGSLSVPIRSAEGYHIVALRQRREPRMTAQQDIKVALNQVFLPIAAGAPAAEAASQRELAQTIAETVNGCADMDAVAKEIASKDSGAMGTFRMGELSAELRKVVGGLAVGQPSQPFPVEGGLRVIMVCERDEPVANLPSRQEVQRLLGEQKMELQSRRFLRDLRQSAFVDIRA
ncbi:MAG: peptidylprolyl isomerase [Alphaproteobacteria bacterium]